MNEREVDIIKFAVWVVPLIIAVYKGWIAYLKHRKEVLIAVAKEKSVGEEEVKKLRQSLKDANDECIEVKNRMKEMREEWGGFRIEMRKLFELLGDNIKTQLDFLNRNQR